ncbi:hypothetical protein ACRALDRAFT_1065885 [Sodiomyces alcalophilus JCM 7366]|uniref:uncharacterized protein n=1 Tax=Sodiomyces alcalophilus JCM 7366 TaxID=591952 RepID=UPI0039B6480D
MTYGMHNTAASTTVAWSEHTANLPAIADEDSSDVDEPPDSNLPYSPIKNGTFCRNPIRRSVDTDRPSLLTKALQSPEEEEDDTDGRPSSESFQLRRSTASNASLASTADLTSDTGLTSPSRTNTPSPPLPELRFLNLNGEPAKDQNRPQVSRSDEHKKELPPKKRRIQFACDYKPEVKPIVQPVPQRPASPAKAASPPPRKTSIKFVCPAPRPVPARNISPRQVERFETAIAQRQPSASDGEKWRGSHQKQRYARSPRPPMPSMPRHVLHDSACKPKKYITVSDKDLQSESSRFHEFASDDPCHDDWIRESYSSRGRKLTIDDTLSKENEIRKIAKEAEEEADEEEDMEAAVGDDDDEDDAGNTADVDIDEDDVQDDDDNDDGEDDDDDEDEDDDDDDYDSVGYHTDEETGFAASDDENEDDGLQLWTPAQPALRLSGSTPVPHRSSMTGDVSDSSIGSIGHVRADRSRKTRRIKIRPGTPELPDSTDFVCGTLDEDLPMEEAYISFMAARRREKLHIIPQDIDPSFPASEPEEEGEEEIFNPVKHASDDEDPWLTGKMDDLHHDQDGRGRKKKGSRLSPRRYHSPPPPKRYHSPPPKRHYSPGSTKPRGRTSPHGLFDRRVSPRRLSPAPPRLLQSPRSSLRAGAQAVPFTELASRPGLTMTKSLPRAPVLFANHRHGRRNNSKLAMTNAANDVHVRGAIDIVKGLERKRQRRKEKFYQKYCNRARKGQIPERKPQPGMGCERMRELGLLMAGKIEQCNYVLSV